MKTFVKFPEQSKCPICKTNKKGKCTLIPIVGTNEDGGMTYEAEVIHLDCINLWYDKESKLIYQRLK